MRTFRATMAALLALGVMAAAPMPASADALTYGGDLLRTGWYADQPGLGPSAVSAADFGQLWSAEVTGQVYAQPLVSHGTVLIATETNDIYGLDVRDGSQKWTRKLHAPWKAIDIGCPDLVPDVGITGTPVIDPATNTAYFLAKTYASGTSGPAAWYAHAIDVATGAERDGFPVAIVGTAANAPGTQFNPTTQGQRAGLLLMDGVVYAAFAGYCDAPPFQGWVVGISTLGAVPTLWSAVAHETGGEGAGIWQSGGGLVSDKPGSIVFATGNGTTLTAPTTSAQPPATGYGEAVVRLNVKPDGSLTVADFFIPYDAAYLNTFDGDLGSGAPIGLPPAYFGTPDAPSLLLEVGKEGYLYVMDASNLGGYKQGSAEGDAVINRIGPDGGVWGKPTPWGGNGGYVYVPTASPGPTGSGSSGFLHAYKYGLDGAGKPTLSLVGSSSDGFGFGSGSAVVTSDGDASGSAMVWTIWRPNITDDAQLRAYDPVPVDGVMQLRRSFPIGRSTKFSVPAVSDNKLFVGTYDGHVLAFGRPVNAVLTAAPLTFPATTVGQSATLDATFTAQQATTIENATMDGAGFTSGPPAPAYGTSLTPGDTLTLPVTFTPAAVGNASGTLTLDTPQGIATIALSGAGQSPSPLLTINPTAISFGGIATGATRTASVMLANAGAQPLQLTSLAPPGAPFDASGLPQPGTEIPSGGEVLVTLGFSPTANGLFADQLVVESSGGTIAVDLTGSAGSPAELAVSSTTITPPDTPVGGWAEQSFTVSNTGGTDLTITRSKPPTGAFTALTSLAEGSRIAAGASVTQRVRFAPAAAGSFSGTWELNGDGASTATRVAFTGTGTPSTGIPSPIGGAWTLSGSATLEGDQLVLTPTTPQVAGASFWPTAVDPSALTVTFDLTIDQGEGADGATFAIIPGTANPSEVGNPGQGLGWAPLGGVAVVFDTHRNENDPADNFVGIAHLEGGAIVLDAMNSTIPALLNSTRHVVITSADGRLAVSIDGIQYLEAVIALPPSALVGFTASTGGRTSRHAISNVSFGSAATAPPIPLPRPRQ